MNTLVTGISIPELGIWDKHIDNDDDRESNNF